jgi:GT2 family glycosyltransferase
LPFINAAAWLVPKTTFEIIGGFDPIFYHYGEDNNFCQRALFHNLKIGVVPNSYIKHDREMRKSSNITTLAERLKAKERIYKYKWANINSNYVTSMKRQKKGILKKVLKNSILLNYRKVYELYLEYKLINRIKVPIELSRFKNKKRGKHYLPSSL